MTLAPASTTEATVVGIDAAIHLEVNRPRADHAADVPDLVELRRDEGLAAKARVHRHHQDEVHLVEHIFDAALGRARG